MNTLSPPAYASWADELLLQTLLADGRSAFAKTLLRLPELSHEIGA